MERPVFGVSASRGFVDWLRERHASLVFATSAGRLFFIGLNDQGRFSLFERHFDRCMGLCAQDDTFFYLNTHCAGFGGFTMGWSRDKDQMAMTAFMYPTVAYTTGDLDAHDISVDRHGRIIFVNTLFSCLATVDVDHW